MQFIGPNLQEVEAIPKEVDITVMAFFSLLEISSHKSLRVVHAIYPMGSMGSIYIEIYILSTNYNRGFYKNQE